MSNRHQTSIWIDNDVYDYFKLHNVNVTNLVNESGYLMMRNENPDHLRRERADLLRRASEIDGLLQKLEDKGKKETIVENLQDASRKQLLLDWELGNRGDVMDDMLQLNWLNGPKRVERVKRAGFSSASECLEWLRDNGGGDL